MKKILVPTDLSAHAKKALQFAAEIALKTRARIELLNVNTAAVYAPVIPEYNMFNSQNDEDYAYAIAEDMRSMKWNLIDLQKFSDLDIDTRIEEGHLHQAINRIVKNEMVDLIVMGTKGAHGTSEFLVGSNTEKVIRTATCPVLTVPINDQEHFNLFTVVLATTLKNDQIGVFKHLGKWQAIFDFDVKLLYMNDPANLVDFENIKSTALKFAEAQNLKNVEIFTSSNIFNEEQGILKFAQELGADMIAMATHQRQGISHLIFGSLTEDTANHSPISVLCVPIV